MKAIQEIENLIKAKYELIYVSTFEEVRLVDDLLQYARENGMNIGVWTFASGLKMISAQNGAVKQADVKGNLSGNPLEILNHIKDTRENTIFVLKDFHSYLKDVEVVRLLKDTIQFMKNAYTPVLITSPVVKLPIELEKEATLVEYSLPDEEFIGEMVDLIVETANIKLEAGQRDMVISACTGLTSIEMENVLSRSIIVTGTLDIKTILTEKEQIVRKSGMLEFIRTEEKLSNVGGISNLITWLRQRKSAFSDKAREFGLPVPKGTILVGVQGCGKSLVCKAVASEWNMPLFKLDIGNVMDSLVGSSEENIRKVLNVAEAVSPCILWIDEIEKGLSGVGSSNFSDAGTTSRVFQYILTWLQDRKKPVFVMATANDLSLLPPELLRAGRFDTMFFIDLPDVDARKEIFRIHLQKKGRDVSKFNLLELAMLSEGYSGAEIEQAIVDALYDVYVKDAGTADITTASIEAALKNMVPLSTVKKDHIEKLRKRASEIARPAN